MDFDDLDDAIAERMADGDLEGLEGLTFEKKELKEFTGKLPNMTTSKGLFVPDVGDLNKDREIKLRAFIFYGPGDKAEDFETRIWQACGAGGLAAGGNPHIEYAVLEWPGIGTRADEDLPDDLDALAADLFSSLQPALDEVKEDADCEGAPFSFVARSLGCQLMHLVSKKIIMTYGMVPKSVIVMDRAPPSIPLLSEKGKEVLEEDPDKVVEAFNFETFADVDKAKEANILKMLCEEKDAFYHKFDCNIKMFTGGKDALINEKGKKKSNCKVTTMSIKGSDKTFRLPVEPTTTIKHLTKVVTSMFAYNRDMDVKVFSSDGEEIKDSKLVPDSVVLEGIQDFEHPRYSWPHPVVLLGGGFHSVKLGMNYHLHKNWNIELFDRHAQAGGDAWHLSATKFSRCQTDFGMFNIWWGHEYCYTGDGGFGTEGGDRKQFSRAFKGMGSPMDGKEFSGAGTGVDYHPVRLQILDSMRYALKEYNMADCSHFLSDVTGLKIVGDPDDEKRYYDLTVKSLATPPKPEYTIKASVVLHFPGAYDINRIIDYPGESEFGGQIGYGMGNGQGGLFVWDDGCMRGKRAAVLGNGAFSVENVRSCAEYGAAKVYIITRRKSLLCPRMPCWFCHMAPDPVPAGFLLDMFVPMYKCAGIEDPWSFYAVNASANRKDVTLKQSSRFGIGDVTFLLHAYGLFEYRVDTLARCTHRTLHLTSGDKLEDMDHICKALGLLGDPRVDKLHAMTHRIGNMINGDWRRIVTADATGMDAKRFTTFSAGPGAAAFAKQWYYIHNHPWEMAAAKKNPDYKTILPVHYMSNTQPDQTVYMTNIAYEMFAGVAFANIWPQMTLAGGDEAPYKYCLINTMHPIDKMMEYSKADWDRYQNLIRDTFSENGFGKHDWVPYPYTAPMVKEWYERYESESSLKYKIQWSGPDEPYKKHTVEEFRAWDKQLQLAMIPFLAAEAKLYPGAKEDEDPMGDAILSSIYNLKKDITSSDSSSGLNFDPEQLEGWKDYVAGDFEFSSEEIQSLFGFPVWTKDLLSEVATWSKMGEFLTAELNK